MGNVGAITHSKETQSFQKAAAKTVTKSENPEAENSLLASQH